MEEDSKEIQKATEDLQQRMDLQQQLIEEQQKHASLQEQLNHLQKQQLNILTRQTEASSETGQEQPDQKGSSRSIQPSSQQTVRGSAVGNKSGRALFLSFPGVIILLVLVLLIGGTVGAVILMQTHHLGSQPQARQPTVHIKGQPQITEFPVVTAIDKIPDDQVTAISSGADGNLWFTESIQLGLDSYTDKIGRITPAGSITKFPVPTTNSFSQSITAGPDGNIWFTETTSMGSGGGSDPGLGATYNSRIGRITPTGSITEFPVPGSSVNLTWITQGPDGNLWFTGSIGIGRITPTGVLTEFPESGFPLIITSGPDGNLWFTEAPGSDSPTYVGRITPNGVISRFPLPVEGHFPVMITSGPDGNLWFTETAGLDSAIGSPIPSEIGRITPAGTITEFPVPGSYTVGGYRPFREILSGPTAITSGPDGNLWFTSQFGTNPDQPSRIGRITPEGKVTEFPIPSAGSFCYAITSGPDGTLWFTEEILGASVSSKIGRLTLGK